MASKKSETTKETIERLSDLNQSQLLARILIEQNKSNQLAERTRKNTSNLIWIIVILIVLQVVTSLI